LQAEISTRHLSFVETGRASPSREMVLHLAEHLEVPLRERNALLLAAGYAPVYPETGLESPTMLAVRTAVRDILSAHEPNPAVLLDRHWNIVDANSSMSLFTAGVAEFLLTPPINALRLSLHPEGAARRIANLAQWRAHLLARLRRQIAHTGDPHLVQLEAEVRGFGGGAHGDGPPVDSPVSDDVVVPLRFWHAGQELAFFSTLAVFGAPLDITIDELAIELFFPSDAVTAAYLGQRPA
jgi:MmyB-like transcription regulator ligand binding domain